MNQISQDVLLALLEILLEKALIPEPVYRQTRSRILETESWPAFFIDGEGENTDADA